MERTKQRNHGQKPSLVAAVLTNPVSNETVRRIVELFFAMFNAPSLQQN